MNDKKKEPLFHIVKRDALPWYQSVGIRAIAIVLALIVCAVVTMILTGTNPIQVFQSIIAGAFGSARKTWITFQNIAILLLISLALTPAFKMKFWNIGGEGQVLIGGLASAACMICLAEKLPAALVVVCMIVTSIAAGAFWAFIPAFFKAKWNTNETLSTLMMNGKDWYHQSEFQRWLASAGIWIKISAEHPGSSADHSIYVYLSEIQQAWL